MGAISLSRVNRNLFLYWRAYVRVFVHRSCFRKRDQICLLALFVARRCVSVVTTQLYLVKYRERRAQGMCADGKEGYAQRAAASEYVMRCDGLRMSFWERREKTCQTSSTFWTLSR